MKKPSVARSVGMLGYYQFFFPFSLSPRVPCIRIQLTYLPTYLPTYLTAYS